MFKGFRNGVWGSGCLGFRVKRFYDPEGFNV